MFDKDLLIEAINTHLNDDVPRLETLYGYYKGTHSILDREDRPNKPNNKLVCCHPSKIVDTSTAYFIGQPVVILDDDLDVQNELIYILKDNYFDDLLLEISKESSIRGKSGMLVYQDEEGKTGLMKVDATELVQVFDTKAKKDITARVYTFTDDSDEEHYAVEVYDNEKVEYFLYEDDMLIPDTRYENTEVNHIFGFCPLIIFKNNEELQGDFEKVMTLIDAYDKLMSDTSNEHEAYRNAYLMLKNLLMSPEAEQKLQQGGTISVGDDGDAKFITKTIQDSAITAHLKKLQEDIHNFTDIPNLSDENFAGNSSGVSLRYKLLGLENKSIIKESKFRRALMQMCKCLSSVINIKIKKQVDIAKLKIQFTRNIPQDLQDIADLIVKLEGIVDKETLLTLLPFVENPQVILDKLAEDDFNTSEDFKDAIGTDVNE